MIITRESLETADSELVEDVLRLYLIFDKKDPNFIRSKKDKDFYCSLDYFVIENKTIKLKVSFHTYSKWLGWFWTGNKRYNLRAKNIIEKVNYILNWIKKMKKDKIILSKKITELVEKLELNKDQLIKYYEILKLIDRL